VCQRTERSCAAGYPHGQMAEKTTELKAFVFLTVVMAPALAGFIIATYGLAVWIYQMFAGPPTG